MTDFTGRGPNVKKLIVRRMSTLMVPAGTSDPMAHAFNEMVRPGGIEDAARQATDWVAYAIGLVKTAPDNPYGDDDEAIAAAILAKMEADRPAARQEP